MSAQAAVKVHYYYKKHPTDAKKTNKTQSLQNSSVKV